MQSKIRSLFLQYLYFMISTPNVKCVKIQRLPNYDISLNQCFSTQIILQIAKTSKFSLRFQVPTAARIKMAAFCKTFRAVSFKCAYGSEVRISETSVYFNEITLRYIPECRHLNLRSLMRTVKIR
jgi:hypothetical protein